MPLSSATCFAREISMPVGLVGELDECGRTIETDAVPDGYGAPINDGVAVVDVTAPDATNDDDGNDDADAD